MDMDKIGELELRVASLQNEISRDRSHYESTVSNIQKMYEDKQQEKVATATEFEQKIS